MISCCDIQSLLYIFYLNSTNEEHDVFITFYRIASLFFFCFLFPFQFTVLLHILLLCFVSFSCVLLDSHFLNIFVAFYWNVSFIFLSICLLSLLRVFSHILSQIFIIFHLLCSFLSVTFVAHTRFCYIFSLFFYAFRWSSALPVLLLHVICFIALFTYLTNYFMLRNFLNAFLLIFNICQFNLFN